MLAARLIYVRIWIIKRITTSHGFSSGKVSGFEMQKSWEKQEFTNTTQIRQERETWDLQPNINPHSYSEEPQRTKGKYRETIEARPNYQFLYSYPTWTHLLLFRSFFRTALNAKRKVFLLKENWFFFQKVIFMILDFYVTSTAALIKKMTLERDPALDLSGQVHW